MDPAMTAVLSDLADQQAELLGVVRSLDGTGWAHPSRCPGWSVCDVVLHLAQTDEMAAASARGRLGEAASRLAAGVEGTPSDVDEWADVVVAAERGLPGAAVEERYRGAATDMLAAFGACRAGDRVMWVAGELSARTLAATRLAETWIHTCDVAAALGAMHAPTDRLRHVARLAWRTLPYAFKRGGRELSGPVAFELTGPGGDAWHFLPDGAAATVVRGDAAELCEVAARRADPAETSLVAAGPDASAVLELVRTFA